MSDDGFQIAGHLFRRERGGVLNFSPGVFEAEMKGIVEWFAAHPPGNAR